jgi:hypothetical protein
MRKFGFAAVAASGIAAGLIGLAAPASAVVAEAPAAVTSSITIPAGIDHQTWLDDITPKVNVPKVDTSVHH